MLKVFIASQPFGQALVWRSEGKYFIRDDGKALLLFKMKNELFVAQEERIYLEISFRKRLHTYFFLCVLSYAIGTQLCKQIISNY